MKTGHRTTTLVLVVIALVGVGAALFALVAHECAYACDRFEMKGP